MATNSEALLDEILIFRDLDAAKRASIAKTCHWRSVEPRENVIGHMESTTNVFFVVQGHLRAINFSRMGKPISYADVGPGAVIGDFAAIDGQTRSTNVVALDDAFIGSMAAKEFWRVIKKYPSVTEALLKRLTGIIRQQNERIFNLSTMSDSTRIHTELLALSRTSGIKDNKARISSIITHAAIASHLGIDRKLVMREINALTKSGVIGKEGRTIIVQNVSWLQDAVATELGELALQSTG